MFSIRAPARACILNDLLRLGMVSIRVPRGSDMGFNGNTVLGYVVSIRAPARERPGIMGVSKPLLLFQSALPRGSDDPLRGAVDHLVVSIRAPAGERLVLFDQGPNPCHVSIRAPARGATCPCGSRCKSSRMFRSALPHGERLHHPRASHHLRRFRSALPHGERPSAPITFQSAHGKGPPERERVRALVTRARTASTRRILFHDFKQLAPARTALA